MPRVLNHKSNAKIALSTTALVARAARPLHFRIIIIIIEFYLFIGMLSAPTLSLRGGCSNERGGSFEQF
jgi:hypothetical protein